MLAFKAAYKILDGVAFFPSLFKVTIAIYFFQFFLTAPLAILLAGLDSVLPLLVAL